MEETRGPPPENHQCPPRRTTTGMEGVGDAANGGVGVLMLGVLGRLMYRQPQIGPDWTPNGANAHCSVVSRARVVVHTP